MTGPKIFIIVLVVLGVLFMVGMGIGLRQNDAQPDDPNNYRSPDWTSSLDWLSPSLDLTKVQAVPSACVQPAQKTFTLVARSKCELQVPTASQKYRKVKLRLVTGASAEAIYTAPPNDPNLNDLKKNPQHLFWPSTGQNKDAQSLVILGGGGRIDLSCGSGPTCVLQMQ